MIRQAVRRLMKSPLTLAAALIAFALGIGINTAMYSVCDALLFHPVALKNLDRLTILEAYYRGQQQGIWDASPADYFELKKTLRSYEDMGLANNWDVTITRDGEPEQISGARVTANWFAVTGAELVGGRGFLAGEDRPGKNFVVVLTQGVALRRFGGKDAIGRKVRLNGEDYLVVGIVRDNSRLPNSAQLWTPYPLTAEFEASRDDFNYMVVGLLKPGVSRREAAAELNAAQTRLVAQYPKTHAGRTVDTAPLNERISGSNDLAASYVRMLVFAAGFVLLIACANVANLQLARVSSRTREFAILSALGAKRSHIARQVLVESTLLSLGGAALGCFFAVWAVDGLKNMLPAEIWQYIPMWPTVSVNWFALFVTVMLSIGAGFLSGVLPAWHSTKSNAQEALREGGRSMSAASGRQWFRAAMVAIQMTLALVLLIGAGLMVRGTTALLQRFQEKHPEQVATVRVVLPRTKYKDAAQRGDFIRRWETQLEALPGAQSVAITNTVPLSDSSSSDVVVVEGRPEPPPAERQRVQSNVVSAGYFETLRIPLREGRVFAATDGAESDRVCVVDELFAASLFPGEKAIGHRVSTAFDEERNWCRIVGIVAPNQQNPWDRAPRRTLYQATAQVRGRFMSALVRTQAPMSAMLPALKQTVFAVDEEQAVKQLYSQQEHLDNALAGMKMVSFMMSGIGLIALALSAVGIFSVVSYVVNERTSEIGMRMAMGASARDVFVLVSRQTLWMCGVGIALGLTAGYALAQLFSGLIWGVSANDFWSLASVSLLLAMVGAIAMYIPARRAMRLDPMEALRHD